VHTEEETFLRAFISHTQVRSLRLAGDVAIKQNTSGSFQFARHRLKWGDIPSSIQHFHVFLELLNKGNVATGTTGVICLESITLFAYWTELSCVLSLSR